MTDGIAVKLEDAQEIALKNINEMIYGNAIN